MLDVGTESRLDECLQRAAVETFELMCFSSAEVVPLSSGEVDARAAGQIEFDGDAAGRLSIEMDAETAQMLASNFYGQDAADLVDTQVDAVVAELTNVVCGGMLSLYAPDGSFRLATPELGSALRRAGDGLHRAFRVELGEVRISVVLAELAHA